MIISKFLMQIISKIKNIGNYFKIYTLKFKIVLLRKTVFLFHWGK